MKGGHIEKFIKSVRASLILWLVVFSLGQLIFIYCLFTYTNLDLETILLVVCSTWIIVSVLLGTMLANYMTKPTKALAEAILHISPNEHLVAAPNVEDLSLGRELVSSLTRQIYDFAANSNSLSQRNDSIAPDFIDDLPNPILGISDTGMLTFANQAALKAFNLEGVTGLKLDSQLKMTFQSDPLDDWVVSNRETTVAAQRTWQKVKIESLNGDGSNYYDLVASFRQKHPSGTETLLSLFEHTEAYEAEGEAISFISLAVHELRTPLTILRGYVEVFEDELGEGLDDEMKGFMHLMSASAENLSAFVSNILSVAKVEQNQLSLNLTEEAWGGVLTEIIDIMRQRAAIHGKALTLTVAKDLPTVALDKVSIAEVITNLIDNAIKYSPETATQIEINAELDKDGAVVTTVIDHGVGIPESVVPNLFVKFYRNHRNRSQIAGTGLGLYLAKAIVTAHHGYIWVKSREGQGTTFGFTLVPYAKLAEELKNNNNSAMIRASHGWIKNHSMQRQ